MALNSRSRTVKKQGSEVSITELRELLESYIKSSDNLNYAIKIMGHPGVGKSAIVKQVAEKLRYHFIDTRLAFKENVDLGGYPVPDNESRQMVYFRPRFIPPEKIPDGYNGIVWFLDESNRAHPTVIQTLFQIITENRCGEHNLPGGTAIILAGNLGDIDETTITDFDDSALDGRLAIFHLKPSANDWLQWAYENELHPSVIKYISLYPEKLWDEKNINPNPRGWHQVSNALKHSYNLASENSLVEYFLSGANGAVPKLLTSLIGSIAGNDFIMQVTSPRLLTTADILEGSEEKLSALRNRGIPSEDLLWALNGTIEFLKEIAILTNGELPEQAMLQLSNILKFIAYSRGDIRMTYFFLILRECGLLTSIPAAIKKIDDDSLQAELKQKFTSLFD